LPTNTNVRKAPSWSLRMLFLRLYKREIFIPSGVVLANCLKLSQQWRAKLYKLNVAGGLPEGVLFLLNIKALLLRGIN
jgi:hypothetical protein